MKTPSNKKPRVVVLYSAGHLGSSVALHLFSKMPEINIVGIVRGDPAPISWVGLKKILKKLKTTGLTFGFLLAWQRFIQFFIFYLIAPILNSNHLKSGWQISKKSGIPCFNSKKINDAASQNFLKTVEPDLIISLYFNQILKKETLDIAKLGSINLHPGKLPEYKGAYVYFWALKNQEKTATVTIHWMDEGIDTGKVISAKNFAISPLDTQQQVVVKSAITGSRELQKIFRNLYSENTNEAENNLINAVSNYYTFPEKSDFNEYIKNRRFFRYKNIFSLIVRRKVRRLIHIKLRKTV